LQIKWVGLFLLIKTIKFFDLFLGQLLPSDDRPVHVTIDKEGRTIDSLTGEILQIPSRVPTLKANLRAQKKDIKQEQPKLKLVKEVVIEHPGLDASAVHFDARIG
jgi:hypothetical protein